MTLGQDIFVDVSQGTLLGTTVHYKENHYLNVDKTFHVFYGIPFVLPPIGNRRFTKPVPMERWEGIWNATYRRSRCPQLRSISDADDKGDEDCLHLNVFAPAQTVRLVSMRNSLLSFNIFQKTYLLYISNIY